MYPDTDTPPLPIPDGWLVEIDGRLAELPWDRRARYRDQGLDDRQAAALVDSTWADLYDALAPKTETGRRRLADALRCRLVHWWREAETRRVPDPEVLRPLVVATDAGTIDPAAYDEVFDALLRGDADVLSRVAARTHELDAALGDVAKRRAELGELADDAVLRWAMGELMPQVRGRVPVAVVRAQVVSSLSLSPSEAA
jgi:Glu-tRNA(Gln) amidotransferase subunit E-like FAD-binding protein